MRILMMLHQHIHGFSFCNEESKDVLPKRTKNRRKVKSQGGGWRIGKEDDNGGGATTTVEAMKMKTRGWFQLDSIQSGAYSMYLVSSLLRRHSTSKAKLSKLRFGILLIKRGSVSVASSICSKNSSSTHGSFKHSFRELHRCSIHGSFPF
ncbi:Uncharacterized protein Rs2_05663 [Raphanus sativus]|nr:Uncharacterized protein Rs2_05663 [Raphanus sativus]